MFFDEVLKFKRSKRDPKAILPDQPKKIVKSLYPYDIDLDSSNLYEYHSFPVLDPKLYYRPRLVENFIQN